MLARDPYQRLLKQIKRRKTFSLRKSFSFTPQERNNFPILVLQTRGFQWDLTHCNFTQRSPTLLAGPGDLHSFWKSRSAEKGKRFPNRRQGDVSSPAGKAP